MSESLVVLIVDDEVLVADIVEAGLREAGFEVVIALSGEEAVAVLEDQAATIRGLVTDVNLGNGMTGFDLGHRARELLPELPVLYMTGDNAHEWSSQGVPNSVLIPKPFVAAQIVNALSSLLNITGV
jgi:CheY-like chemotaxis protein